MQAIIAIFLLYAIWRVYKAQRDRQKLGGQSSARRPVPASRPAQKPTSPAASVPAAREKPVEETAPVVDMVRHLRPGMRVEEVDAIAEASGGLLTRETLSATGSWKHGPRPCSINVYQNGDAAGTISSVSFLARLHDPEGIGRFASVQDVLDQVPGAKLCYRTLNEENMDRQWVELPSEDPNIVTRAEFSRGEFLSTRYTLAEAVARVDAYEYAYDQKARAAAAAKQAAKETWDALPLDEKLAKVRVPRREQEASQSVDGALRAWAGVEGSEHWRPFVEWLIHDSTPDDRHNLVDMNWDGHPIAIFVWIAQQTDTDTATAAKIIWQAGAAFYLDDLSQSNGASLSNDYHLERLDLADEAAERIRAGFYVPRVGHVPIAYDGPPVPVGVSDDPLRRAAEDRLVPGIIRAPIAGRSEDAVPFKVPKRFRDLLN